MAVKALIFAAGVGSRLRPLTDRVPKALIEVGGMPMLERTVRRLAQAGITEIVINAHHHAGQIHSWARSFSALPQVRLSVSDESALLLDTGGGLLHARPLLEGAEAVVLHNADIFTDINIRALLDAHLQRGADATLAVMERPTSRKLLFDREMLMRGWLNEATGEVRPPRLRDELGGELRGLRALGFCGVHVVAPTLLRALAEYAAEAGEVFSMTPFYVAQAARLRICGALQPPATRWVDIGRPETLRQARSLFP